jgi:hypothetical protein
MYLPQFACMSFVYVTVCMWHIPIISWEGSELRHLEVFQYPQWQRYRCGSLYSLSLRPIECSDTDECGFTCSLWRVVQLWHGILFIYILKFLLCKNHNNVSTSMSSKVHWSVSGFVPKKYVLFRKTTWMLKTQRLCVVTKNPKRMLTLKDELSLVTTSDRGVKTWCVRTPYPEREWQVSWWFHPRNLCASVRE